MDNGTVKHYPPQRNNTKKYMGKAVNFLNDRGPEY